MKSGVLKLAIPLLIVVGIVLAYESCYVVDEGEQAVITEFGEPIDDVTEAGLHFKTPFTQRVRRFQKRALEFDGAPDELVTADKKLIFIDTFARWRISDPRTFLKAVATESGAQARLDDVIDSATRTAIANHRLIEAVRNSNAPLSEDPDIQQARRQLAQEDAAARDDSFDGGESAKIEKGREKICEEILAAAREHVSKYGIELIDVQIKRINYVKDVEDRVVDRMISDRQQIAEMLRSEGLERQQSILGEVDREKNRIISEAYREAEELRGKAEAEATGIYAEAFGRDPEFYRFWRSLELYRATMGENVTVVLDAKTELFRGLSGAGVFASVEE